MTKILAVDDEVKNLKLIKGFLSLDGCDVVTAEDGVIAWEILQESHEEFDVILLDRMMPNMNGMELLKKIKETPSMSDIPLIMQTAAADKTQVAEGIAAGVYYYLTKPYSRKILKSIIDSAVSDCKDKKSVLNEVNKYEYVVPLVKKAQFMFSTLNDARYLISYLSEFYPDPKRAVVGISELLINAIEHGNLGISYDEKTTLNFSGKWEEEVIRRQSLPENCDKKVVVDLALINNEIKLTIKDEGRGFDWKKYLQFDTSRVTDNHGRGIAMSNISSFDSLEYCGNGNQVVCKVFTEK